MLLTPARVAYAYAFDGASASGEQHAPPASARYVTRQYYATPFAAAVSLPFAATPDAAAMIRYAAAAISLHDFAMLAPDAAISICRR